MKRLMMTALASSLAIAVATPASAVVLVANGAPVTPTAGLPTGPGAAVATGTFNGVALTFATQVKYAVYLTAGGTYDFYFQVSQTGAGTKPGASGNQAIKMLTLANYSGFTVDAYASAGDPDGAGFFTAANNGGAGTSTTVVSLDDSGQTVTFNFGTNDLVTGETSATYILRTNATNYDAFGSFGVIDGSAIGSVTFEPTAGVPEPATWGMMIAGFGLMGGVLRRRKATVAFA